MALAAASGVRPRRRFGETWPRGSVERVFEQRFAAGALGVLDHRAELCDDAEGVAVVDEPLELREFVLEPVGVDLRARCAHDLRVRGRPYGLAFVPEHLVHLLA